MYLNTDYYTPADLTGYVRTKLSELPANQFSLRRWLPTKFVSDLEARYNKGTGGLTPTATYRAFDAESRIGKRRPISREAASLPPLSEKIRLGEYDLLRTRANPDDSIRSQLDSDGVMMGKKIEARLEVARADALVNGSVTISENGVIQTVDFGRNASNTTAPSVLWSVTATADPISDLTTWTQYYVDTNGVPPGALLTSTRVRGYLLRNAAIRSLAGNMSGTPTIVSVDTLNTILNSYDLPPIYVYDASYENAAGAAAKVIPDTDVLLLPAPVAPDDAEGTELGATFWGNTAESLEADFGLQGNEPGIAVGVYKTVGPVSLWTEASAISIPVMPNPDLSFRARVAA